MNEEWVKKYFKAFDRNHRQVPFRVYITPVGGNAHSNRVLSRVLAGRSDSKRLCSSPHLLCVCVKGET